MQTNESEIQKGPRYNIKHSHTQIDLRVTASSDHMGAFIAVRFIDMILSFLLFRKALNGHECNLRITLIFINKQFQAQTVFHFDSTKQMSKWQFRSIL